MKTIHLFLFFVLSYGLTGQNIIDQQFSHLKANEDYTKVFVTGKMFDMAANMEVESDDARIEDVQELLSGIRSFSMIMGPEESQAKIKYLDAAKVIGASHEELMSVDDQQGSFTFYIDEAEGMVSELVMVGATKGQFMVASLNGSIDLKKLGQVTKQIRQEGFGPMSKMFEHGADDVKVYPNPAVESDVVKVDLPQNLVNGVIVVYDMNGQMVLKKGINSTSSEISNGQLAKGRYVVEIEQGDVRIKKNLIVQ